MPTDVAFCQGYGDNPSCLGAADPRYDMDYSDIGKDTIHWCAHCGPIAHAQRRALEHAFATRPGFTEELAEAIAAAKAETLKAAN